MAIKTFTLLNLCYKVLAVSKEQDRLGTNRTPLHWKQRPNNNVKPKWERKIY